MLYEPRLITEMMRERRLIDIEIARQAKMAATAARLVDEMGRTHSRMLAEMRRLERPNPVVMPVWAIR